MPGKLYLVRHGRTAWNGERFLGRADLPLDGTGREQADALVARFAGVRIDAIYTSPLQRAQATAAPLAANRGLVPILHDDLQEVDCGAWEGALKDGHQKIARRVPDDPFPDGESLRAAYGRAAAFIATVAPDLDSDADLLVVGHYLTNHLVSAVLAGIPVEAAFDRPDQRLQTGAAIALDRAGGLIADPR